MLNTFLDNLGWIILLSGGALFLFVLIRTAIRKEKTRNKRLHLMQRVQRLKKQLEGQQGNA